jgi:hypothetical protein
LVFTPFQTLEFHYQPKKTSSFINFLHLPTLFEAETQSLTKVKQLQMSRKAKSNRNFGAQLDEIEDNFEVGRNDTSQGFKAHRSQEFSHLETSAMVDDTVVSDDEFNRQYDLTPYTSKRDKRPSATETTDNRAPTTPSYSIDPWEVASTDGSEEYQDGEHYPQFEQGRDGAISSRMSHPTFLVPSDIHPNMEQREEDIAQLRLLAGKLNADWGGQDFMAPALARRIRDFQFAQEKRRKKYGDERPWGILGLYDHLAAIRVDVEWAEDAAWRRANGEP